MAEENKIKVEISLNPDEYGLLKLVAKYYAITDLDRSPESMAQIIVCQALKRIVKKIQEV